MALSKQGWSSLKNIKSLFTWMKCAPAHRVKRIGGLKESPPWNETQLRGMAIFLSGPLSTTNKIADQRNVLAGALILLLLVFFFLLFIYFSITNRSNKSTFIKKIMATCSFYREIVLSICLLIRRDTAKCIFSSFPAFRITNGLLFFRGRGGGGGGVLRKLHSEYGRSSNW